MSITDRTDPRLKDLVRLLSSKPELISIGVHGQEGEQGHANGEQTVAEIAEAHEFGLGVPMRSWLRAWFDEREPEIEKVLITELQRAARVGKPWRWALERVALWAQADIQARIAKGIEPPNSPETKAKKGSSTPLVDTGLLKASILARVGGVAP